MGTSHFSNQQQETILKELAQGQEFASQLHLLFKTQSNNNGDHLLDQFYSPTMIELLHKISTSFNHAISALTTTKTAGGRSSEMNQQAADAVSHGEQQSSAGSGPFEEDSGQSRKRLAAGKSGAAAAGRDNRGSYKRRKNGHSRIIVSSSSSTQDGHAWRKYGQKEILHAKFPRSYFRCTHKYEQGCKATKQVQQLEQETEMYSITYLGQHTCRNALMKAAAPPSAVADSNENKPAVNVKQEACTTVSKGGNSTSMNEESATPSGVTTDDHEMIDQNGGTNTTNMWQDLVSFGPPGAEEAVSNYEYDFANYDYYGHDGGQGSNNQILNLDFSGEFEFDPEESCGFF